MSIVNISSSISNDAALLTTTQTRKTNFVAFKGATFNFNFPVYNFDGTIFDLTGWYPVGSMSLNVYDVPNFIPLTVSIVGDPKLGIINWFIDETVSLSLHQDRTYVFNIDIINGLNNLDWNTTPYTWAMDTFPWDDFTTPFKQRILRGNLTVIEGVNY